MNEGLKTIIFETAVFGLILTFGSCNTDCAPQSTRNPTPQKSELAALMRVMEQHGDEVRYALNNGKELPSKPQGIDKLLEAETSPNMNIRQGSFPAFVKEYQKQIEALYSAPQENQKSVFNGVIQACENCHAVNCPGPLMKIEKMFIKP